MESGGHGISESRKHGEVLRWLRIYALPSLAFEVCPLESIPSEFCAAIQRNSGTARQRGEARRTARRAAPTRGAKLGEIWGVLPRCEFGLHVGTRRARLIAELVRWAAACRKYS